MGRPSRGRELTVSGVDASPSRPLGQERERAQVVTLFIDALVLGVAIGA